MLTFRNGSRIIAGHFQAEKDIDAYLGLEYDVIGIEEATTLSSRKHTDISTCCRSSKVLADGHHWRPRIYSTSNPGGIGPAWYRAKFVVPFLERREVETRFVPARVKDNAFNNPEYQRVLESLTGWQKRAWLDGDWDIAAGQFFTTFRREVHAIAEFDETRAREWFAALDYGFTHYTVVLLGCTDGDGKPTMFIHRRCGRLLETLPSLQHDPNRPEDVLKVDADEDGVGGDDAADALRYLVATKGREVRLRKLRGL